MIVWSYRQIREVIFVTKKKVKNRKKRKNRFFIFLCSVLFVAVGITIAYAASEMIINTATNVATVGNVQIELINKDDEDVNLYSKEPDFENKEVIPGDTIPKKVSVKNTGDYAACIRLKVKKEWSGPTTISTAAIVLNYNPKDWKLGEPEEGYEKKGYDGYEYYYYQKCVRARDEINFIKSFSVDERLIDNNQMSSEKNGTVMGTIKVEAEAVQADFYAYDKDGNRLSNSLLKVDKTDNSVIGWNDVVFEEGYVNDTPMPVATGGAVTGSAVTPGAVSFIGDTGNFVTFGEDERGEDLFINIKGMMPGEVRQQTINIENSTDDQIITVYMHSTVPDEIIPGSLEEELLQTLKMRTIKWERNLEKTKNTKKMTAVSLGFRNSAVKKQDFQRTIVQTTSQPLPTWKPLFNFENRGVSEKPEPLGSFQPGEKARLTIEIYLPPTWKHSYCKTSVNWVFQTDKMLMTSHPNYSSYQTPAPTLEPEIPSEEPPTVAPEETIEPVEPTIEPVKPTIEPVKPTIEPPKPTIESIKPTIKPVKPTIDPTSEPVVEATDKPVAAPETPAATVPATIRPIETLTPVPTSAPEVTPDDVVPTPTYLEPEKSASPMPTPTLDTVYTVPDRTTEPVIDMPEETTPSSPQVIKATVIPGNTKEPEEPEDPEDPEKTPKPQIVEPSLPNESATKTGDETPVFFWSFVCIASLLGVLYNGIVLVRKS